METAVVPVQPSTRGEAKKQLLYERIVKKRKRFQLFVTKTEMLRVELEMVKQEYDVRVGSLYLKDNQLDLEIIHYRNILELMEQGMSFEEATKSLHETYYAKQREIDEEKARIREEEEIIIKREEHKNDGVPNIKKLWKKLIGKFHPDLVQDATEKKNREATMIQINKAYEEHDYDSLLRIEKNSKLTKKEDMSIEQLEEVIVDLENDMIKQAKIYRELQESEWFQLKIQLEKAKKKRIDFFADIERKLLDDIVRKYDVLRALKKQVN